MNSVHDSTKDWQPGEPADVPLQYTPMDHHGYPLGAPVHPPVRHHQHPSYPPYQGKSETEMRIAGRPSPVKVEAAVPARTAHPSPSALPSPAPSGTTPYRKRSRSDSLFPAEPGPFFSSTKPYDNLFAMDRTSLLTVRIHSKMDRGFFLADSDWTCYRRNYFQVSSAFSIHGINHYYTELEPPCFVRTEDGVFHPVRRFALGISARVSNSEKRIELVQHTPKRDKGPQMTPRPKPIVPGGNLNMSAVGTNQNIVTFERVQFKTATANNGKRRAAQQYYVCVVELFAEIDGGEQIRVASCQSASLVVRGRSPGHYTDSQQERAPSSTATAPTASHHHHHHHDRFYSSRPPYTHPMMGEYNQYPPYYPQHHPHPYMSAMVMSPTSAASAAPGPPPQANYHPAPYMVAGMPVSSPQSPHYPQEFAAAAAAAAAAASAPSHSMAPAAGTNGNDQPKLSPSGCIESPTDWSRSRISSTSSMSQSYFSAQGTPTLSSTASQTSAFSPTTPTTPYGGGANGGPRKYSTVSNICNQQPA